VSADASRATLFLALSVSLAPPNVEAEVEVVRDILGIAIYIVVIYCNSIYDIIYYYSYISYSFKSNRILKNLKQI